MREKITRPIEASSIEISEVHTHRIFKEINQCQTERKKEAAKKSPYRLHRDKIFGHYSTAYRLQSLILHIYNSDIYKCNLGGLFGNADIKHRDLAIEIIKRYSILGEDDKDFMETARELEKRRMLEAKVEPDISEE